MPLDPIASRRRFLAHLGSAASALAASHYLTPGLFAQQLEERTRTPSLTAGPFYPDHLPLDTDNDLIMLNDSLTPAVGQITHLSGRILDLSGNPVRNAVIEIWQVDGNGCYLHSRGENPQSAKGRDKHFQGFGRFLTGSSGEYYFRTVKPVPYPGRTPHIHVRIRRGDRDLLTTQFFVKGEARNARDGILRSIRSDTARNTILADYTPIPDSKSGELVAKYDVVLGLTPEA